MQSNNLLFKLKQEISANSNYLIMVVVVSFLTLLPQLFLTHSKILSSVFASFVFLLFLASCSKSIFAIFIAYFNFISLALFNNFVHWGAGSNLFSRLDLAMISPAYEMLEYLQTYIDYRDILFLGYVIVVFTLLAKLLLAYKIKFKTLKKIAWVMVVIFVAILQNNGHIKLIKHYFIAVDRSKIFKDRANYIATLTATNNTFAKGAIEYDKVIIIQGESVNKDFMAVYGYNKNTTPFLSGLSQAGKLYIFNAISPTNQTRYSVPAFFTSANVADWHNKYIRSQSIVTDFKNFNYQTHWVTNQGRAGKFDDYNVNIALESDKVEFINSGNYETVTNTDIVLLDYLQKTPHRKQKEFYVFHLLGSHQKYNKRYPATNALYKNPKNVIEEYENTLFFSDYIIKNIAEQFMGKNQKLLLIYVSDHGEVVNLKESGHGFLPTYKDEYRVPFVAFSSVKNPRLDKLLKSNQKHYFNLENLNYLIKYITYLSDKPNISYSPAIFSLDPANTRSYDKIKFYK